MKSKTYKVTGQQRVFATEPGETFKRALSPEQEKRLVANGHISVVQAASKSRPKRGAKSAGTTKKEG